MSDPAESSVLDPETIASLKELGGEDDPGLFADLVDIFLSETPKLMAQMRAALASGDLAALERAAHSLKSSSANLGACALSGLLRDLELAGRQRDLDHARPLVGRVDDEYPRVERALKALVE
jgi:HPt (histidine-containing phosphotransfer) domain-containing protein